MGRKPVTVNKKSAERITILLRFLGLSQEQFADKTGYSRQSINAFARGTRRLTNEAAERISQCYPYIRTEWLLGYDDYMTVDDKKLADDKFFAGHSLLSQSFLGFARFNGFEFNSKEINAKDQSVEIPDNIRDVPLISIFFEGKKIGNCSPAEYGQTIIEISDFVEFKIKKLCEQSRN